jgi:hypothetical protein
MPGSGSVKHPSVVGANATTAALGFPPPHGRGGFQMYEKAELPMAYCRLSGTSKTPGLAVSES